MMKKLLILLMLLFVFTSDIEASNVALLIQSTGSVNHESVVQGIKSEISLTLKRVVLSGTPDYVDIDKEIERANPELIITIGQDALQLVKDVSSVPVGYIFAANPGVVRNKKNFFGITLNLKQPVQFEAVKELLPSINHIGFIYNPDTTENLETHVLSAVEKTGHTILFKPVNNPENVAPMLIDLSNKVDGVWLYTDISLMTTETIESLFLFSLENQVPIISFSGNFVFRGATVSINIDEFKSGKKLGELAKRVLMGEALETRSIDPENASITINDRIVNMIDAEIVNRNKYLETD